MEIRISQELNSIIKYAGEEALRTGSYGIGADHLFLGILRHEDNNACKVITSLGIVTRDMKSFIDKNIFTNETIPYNEIENITFSRSTQNILTIALMEAARMKQQETGSEHLLLALMHSAENYGQNFLKQNGIDYSKILIFMQEKGIIQSNNEVDPKEKQDNQIEIEEFGFDLTKAAKDGNLDPVIGRDDEIERVIEILGRRKKNNPMIIGEAGVGKSAIVEGIAQRIVKGNISPDLAKKRIISLDIASIVAGTRYRGDFEKRIKIIIEKASNDPDLILFIDEFHTIIGAGGSQGGLDAANILKPALTRGQIRCIGATTIEEFGKTIEKDGALDRRFQKIIIEPTDTKKTTAILKELKQKYGGFHNVTYTDEAIEACVNLTNRYITDRFLPDKAIDVLDEAGARVKFKKKKNHIVEAEDIAAIIANATGIPVQKVSESEGARLLNMSKILKQHTIGQDEAIDTVVKAIQRNRAGLKDPNRPIGSFLFLGPTGVGKTQLAKQIAEYLFDSGNNLIRIDMSEYMEKFSASRLIGAPPGYIGYDKGGELSEKVRRKPYSVILLDEIEKAHPDIFNLLLQVLDEGRLTDSTGRTVDFKNTILIMTSNIGSKEIDDYGVGVGFMTAGKNDTDQSSKILNKAIKNTFSPEFLNRIDEQVYFNRLSRESIEKIIDIELANLKSRIQEAGYKLRVSNAVKDFTANAGYDRSNGARPLKRAIIKYIENPVSEFILTDKLERKAHDIEYSDVLKVDLDKRNNEIKVSFAKSNKKKE